MSQPFWDSTNGAFDQWLADLGEGSLWDTATLGGKQVPGLVKVSGAEVGRNWDIKPSPGTDGATYTDQGYALAKPTLTVLIWTPAQWALWQQMLPQIAPRPGKVSKKPPAPVSVTHPALNSLGINALVILTVSAMEPASPKGAMQATIKTSQYLKPKKAGIKTARGAIDLDNQGSALPPPLAPTNPSAGGGAGP